MTSKALQNPYFVGYIVYKYWQNTFITTKLFKIGPYFCILFWRGGGGACGKKMVERKCKSENASKDDFWSTPKSIFCRALLYI